MKHRLKFLVLAAVLLMGTALVIPAYAQSDSPTIAVSDQVSSGSVIVDMVYSDGPGFVVIRNDNGRGAPGVVLGETAVGPGWSVNVPVALDTGAATGKLFAALHTDDNTAGTFDFGKIGGADAPVSGVIQEFSAPIIQMDDQFVAEDGSVTAGTIIIDTVGWLVIHSDNNGAPGPVLGQTALVAGRNRNVSVALSTDGLTPVVWPMLHVDDGEVGTYEFGTVEGADAPVFANGNVATMPIWTEPHVRMDDQIAIPGDANKAADAAAPTVVVKSVLSKGPGFLVVHQDNNGSFGGVAGYAPVTDGLNTDVEVTLDQGDVTTVLWPMLHVDTGVEGTYEFGTVEGADGPVVDSAGNVVTFPIQVAPTLVMSDQELVPGRQTIQNGVLAPADATIMIDEALIDAPGWIAIHSSVDNAPGPVIATYPLHAGVNSNAVIALDPTEAGTQVFPMLHYDTGEPGVYEFGAVEGADAPVFVNEAVVVAPLGLGGAASTDSGSTAASTGCTVSASGQSVNKRSSNSTNASVVGALSAGESADVIGQAASASGATWWALADGSWVREDVVTENGDCSSVPTVDAPAVSTTTSSEPATTPEPGS